jgi:nicotinamidase-related amidase
VALRHGRGDSARPHVPTRGSAAWQLAGVPSTLDVVVDCRGFDGCYGSTLVHELRAAGRDHILLGGYASEITVDSTVRRLNDSGLECLVVTDACAPLDPDTGARAHASLTMSGGIFGALASSDAVLAALADLEALGDPAHAAGAADPAVGGEPGVPAEGATVPSLESQEA